MVLIIMSFVVLGGMFFYVVIRRPFLRPERSLGLALVLLASLCNQIATFLTSEWYYDEELALYFSYAVVISLIVFMVAVFGLLVYHFVIYKFLLRGHGWTIRPYGVVNAFCSGYLVVICRVHREDEAIESAGGKVELSLSSMGGMGRHLAERALQSAVEDAITEAKERRDQADGSGDLAAAEATAELLSVLPSLMPVPSALKPAENQVEARPVVTAGRESTTVDRLLKSLRRIKSWHEVDDEDGLLSDSPLSDSGFSSPRPIPQSAGVRTGTSLPSLLSNESLPAVGYEEVHPLGAESDHSSQVQISDRGESTTSSGDDMEHALLVKQKFSRAVQKVRSLPGLLPRKQGADSASPESPAKPTRAAPLPPSRLPPLTLAPLPSRSALPIA